MSLFIARQPIFDKNMDVFGYELLYRSGMMNSYLPGNADLASSDVMINSFCVIGLDKLTNEKKAFINFTENLLKQDVATLFPKERLVVEVLEDVTPGLEIVDRCRQLKNDGYVIALDDFVLRDDYLPLVEIADIIKVDFLATKLTKKREIANNLKGKNVKLLAEKVETPKQFEQAKALGYSYFQGYFFSKPVILTTEDIPPMKIVYLQLIEKVNREDVDFTEVAEVVIRDVSLSYKLLRLVNSAAFGFRSKIVSLRHAMVVLGTKELKKLVSLMALRGLGDDKPDEVLQTTLVRAKFAELLASDSAIKARREECFLMGLFSTLDVLMDRPMEEVLSGIPVTEDVILALLKKEGHIGFLYRLILSYEQGEWVMCNSYATILGINADKILDMYLKALQWTNYIE